MNEKQVNANSVEEFWEQAYASGEFRNHWDYSYPSQELVTFMACNLLPAGETVLDVGCGAGREAIFLAQCGFRPIGVDLSPTALQIAKERASAAGVEVDWRHGNVLELPVEDQSVVFVNDRGCFHKISDEDRPQYAAQIARVLKPGGYLLLRGCRKLDGEVHFHLVNEESIDRYFSDAFTRGPVVPIQMISDAGGTGLPANLAVLRRK